MKQMDFTDIIKNIIKLTDLGQLTWSITDDFILTAVFFRQYIISFDPKEKNISITDFTGNLKKLIILDNIYLWVNELYDSITKQVDSRETELNTFIERLETQVTAHSIDKVT